MQVRIKAKKFGGSIGIILPRDLVEAARIFPEDLIKVSVEKISDLRFLCGKWEGVKESTKEIMNEIDEGEDD